MDFKIKIHNIGRLHRAEISVKPLTVLAGPNNTGKSFFSKSLYSLFDAMNMNPLLARIPYHLNILSGFLRYIDFYNHFLYPLKNQKASFIERRSWPVSKLKKKYEKTDRQIPIEEEMEKSLKKEKKEQEKIEQQIHRAGRSVRQLQKSCRFLDLYPSTGIFGSVRPYPEIADNLNKTLEHYRSLFPYCENLLKPKTEILQEKRPEQIKDMEHNFKKMKDSFKYLEKIKNMKEPAGISDEKILAEAFGPAFADSLTANFQVASIKKLKNNEKALAFIEMENKGQIKIEENNNISADLLFLKGLFRLQNSRVLYIESPFFWKFRKALNFAVEYNRPGFSKRRNLLTPKYFNDLSLFLYEELSGDPAFPEVLESLKQTVKGRLVVDEAGGLIFKELGGKAHSLPMTATGVVQMSVLALLIEKKILDKGTVLFIDKPETNLHPAWQVKMMEVLFQLVKGGAQVVTATHSVDIIKWLETHLKKHPEDENLIALNQLALNDCNLAETPETDRDIFEKIQSVKKNLTDPFLELFLKGEGRLPSQKTC